MDGIGIIIIGIVLFYIYKAVKKNNKSSEETKNQIKNIESMSVEKKVEREYKRANLKYKKWVEVYSKEFIALDFETTGLSYHKHKIIEICLLKYKDGYEVDRYVTLVNPEMHIPSSATKVNHITDSMVSGKPTIEGVINTVEEFIGDSPLAIHNASFDMGFLINSSSKVFANPVLDTVAACRSNLDLPNNKLKTIVQYFEIDTGKLHRAVADTEAVAMIVLKLISICEDDSSNK